MRGKSGGGAKDAACEFCGQLVEAFRFVEEERMARLGEDLDGG
jgi:hypothetical protein